MQGEERKNGLREYDDMKEEVKNLKASTVHLRI